MIGAQERMNAAVGIAVGYQKRDQLESKERNTDSFRRLPASSAQSIIGTEIYTDGSINLSYPDDDHSQGNSQFKEAFRALPKDDKLQLSIPDSDFRSSNDGNDVDCNLYFFIIRCRKIITAAQSIKV